MKRFTGLCAAALTGAVILAGSGASAAMIHLNVSKGWTTGSHSYTNGSETVTAEAVHYDDSLPPALSGNPFIASWSGGSGGIGVCSGSVSQGCSEQHTVDGANNNEMVLFDFGTTIVELTGITFAYVDANDQFEVFAFGDGVGAPATDWDITQSLPDDCSVCFTTNFSIEQGSIFGIGAFGDNSEWKIKKIHYNVVSQVPLPAGLALLLSGLGGLGLAGWRRRRVMAA